jgi:hypothetical protein
VFPPLPGPKKYSVGTLGCVDTRSKEKREDQSEFLTTMRKEKRVVVKLLVFKCPDLVDLACISNIRRKMALELTFRVFHVHFEVMLWARLSCRSKRASEGDRE